MSISSDGKPNYGRSPLLLDLRQKTRSIPLGGAQRSFNKANLQPRRVRRGSLAEQLFLVRQNQIDILTVLKR